MFLCLRARHHAFLRAGATVLQHHQPRLHISGLPPPCRRVAPQLVPHHLVMGMGCHSTANRVFGPSAMCAAWRALQCGCCQGCIGNPPPPPPGRPAATFSLTVPASMAFVTDGNRHQPLRQPSSLLLPSATLISVFTRVADKPCCMGCVDTHSRNH